MGNDFKIPLNSSNQDVTTAQVLNEAENTCDVKQPLKSEQSV